MRAPASGCVCECCDPRAALFKTFFYTFVHIRLAVDRSIVQYYRNSRCAHRECRALVNTVLIRSFERKILLLLILFLEEILFFLSFFCKQKKNIRRNFFSSAFCLGWSNNNWIKVHGPFVLCVGDVLSNRFSYSVVQLIVSSSFCERNGRTIVMKSELRF